MNSKVVWITGSASGVGLHLTKSFLKRGYRVVATDIAIDELKNQADKHQWDTSQLILKKLDVTKRKDWQAILLAVERKWQTVDYLFNVAGYLKPGYIHQSHAGEIDKHIDINVKGVMIGSQIMAQHMVANGCGHIVNVASLAGIAPVPGISIYSASKFAVRGFTLVLAQELKPYGVDVTVVCPDAIETPMLKLQESYDEAALTFSGSKALSLKDIENVIFKKVIPDAPMEIAMPWPRGVLAKVSSALPQTADLFSGILRMKGRRQQAKRNRLKSA